VAVTKGQRDERFALTRDEGRKTLKRFLLSSAGVSPAFLFDFMDAGGTPALQYLFKKIFKVVFLLDRLKAGLQT
jgi:hypothetical protein